MESFTSIQTNTITSNISNTAFRIYCFLNSMCFGKKNNCFPSQTYISSKLHMCVRTIQRGLKELSDAKIIKVKRRGSISNIYFILKKVTTKKASENMQKIDDTVKKLKNTYHKSKSDNFNNFKQRKYNFKNLEDMLLGNSEYNPKKLQE